MTRASKPKPDDIVVTAPLWRRGQIRLLSSKLRMCISWYRCRITSLSELPRATRTAPSSAWRQISAAGDGRALGRAQTSSSGGAGNFSSFADPLSCAKRWLGKFWDILCLAECNRNAVELWQALFLLFDLEGLGLLAQLLQVPGVVVPFVVGIDIGLHSPVATLEHGTTSRFLGLPCGLLGSLLVETLFLPLCETFGCDGGEGTGKLMPLGLEELFEGKGLERWLVHKRLLGRPLLLGLENEPIAQCQWLRLKPRSAELQLTQVAEHACTCTCLLRSGKPRTNRTCPPQSPR